MHHREFHSPVRGGRGKGFLGDYPETGGNRRRQGKIRYIGKKYSQHYLTTKCQEDNKLILLAAKRTQILGDKVLQLGSRVMNFIDKLNSREEQKLPLRVSTEGTSTYRWNEGTKKKKKSTVNTKSQLAGKQYESRSWNLAKRCTYMRE